MWLLLYGINVLETLATAEEISSFDEVFASTQLNGKSSFEFGNATAVGYYFSNSKVVTYSCHECQCHDKCPYLDIRIYGFTLKNLRD